MGLLAKEAARASAVGDECLPAALPAVARPNAPEPCTKGEVKGEAKGEARGEAVKRKECSDYKGRGNVPYINLVKGGHLGPKR